MGPDRDERTPKSAGSTRTFSANSLRNGTGNFKRRTGNSFGRSGNFQGRAGNLSARTPCNRLARFLPETSSILRSPKRQISSSSPQRRAMYSTRLWMCAAMIYPAGPGAYDTGEFVELPQAHLNRLGAGPFSPWLCRGRRAGTRLSGTAPTGRQA